MKYVGYVLKKGKKELHVLFYVAPDRDSHIHPSGARRGKYACMDEHGRVRWVCTHNVSRLVWLYHYSISIDEEPCERNYLHAQHAVEKQENVLEKKKGLWARFISYFS